MIFQCLRSYYRLEGNISEFVEFLSGNGWRLNEIKSSGSVSLLPKKKDYADTYHENSTNMARALEKRAYDLVGEL